MVSGSVIADSVSVILWWRAIADVYIGASREEINTSPPGKQEKLGGPNRLL